MSGLRLYSTEEKSHILTLHRQGKDYSQISKIICEQSGASTTRSGIRKFILRHKKTANLSNSHRFAKRLSCRKLSLDMLAAVDAYINADREISAPEIQRKLLFRFGVCTSIASISRNRRSLGWIWTGVQYCQLVQEVNRVKRIDFCLLLTGTKDRLDDVIFTDESTVKCETSTGKCFRRKGEKPQLKPKPKHPFSIHVWGGISRRGATALHVFSGIMTREGYQKILEETLLPFIQQTYPDGHRLWQDNDPKHSRKSTQAWLNAKKINHYPSPPESPDLNPIERIWAALKRHIRRVTKPTNKQELIEGMQTFWLTVTPEMCNKYIDSLRKDAKTIIVRNGYSAGH